MTTGYRQILHVRLHHPDESTYLQLLALLADITPLVQALPPAAADLDVTGALRYHGLNTEELAHVILLRAAAHCGAALSIGAAGNRMLAQAASRLHPGSVTVVGTSPNEVARFLRPQPVRALDGIGPASAALLARYGLRTVGALAGTPLPTLQRILGNRVGRAVHERAHGNDPRPVTGRAPATSRTAEHHFTRDELDPGRQRTALLALADQLGATLRTDHRLCTRLSLTVAYADATSTTKAAPFTKPTSHTPDLAILAGRMHAALALQRARVRVLALRAIDLVDADLTPRQLTFDPSALRAELAEQAADAACARFGQGAVTRGSPIPVLSKGESRPGRPTR